MESSEAKFTRFIERVKDLKYRPMVRGAEYESAKAEASVRSSKNIGLDRASIDWDFARLMRGFLFFMQSGVAPHGFSIDEFQLFRPVCEGLVEKGQLSPTVLLMFVRQPQGDKQAILHK